MSTQKLYDYQEPEEEMDRLTQLPLELIEKIADHLDFVDLMTLSFANFRLFQHFSERCRKLQDVTLKGSEPVDYYLIDVKVSDGHSYRYQLSQSSRQVELQTTAKRNGEESTRTRRIEGVVPRKYVENMLIFLFSHCEIDSIHIGLESFCPLIQHYHRRLKLIGMPICDALIYSLPRLQPLELYIFHSQKLDKPSCQFTVDVDTLNRLRKVSLLEAPVTIPFDQLMNSPVESIVCSCQESSFSRDQIDQLLLAWYSGTRPLKSVRVVSTSPSDSFLRGCFPEAEDIGYPEHFPNATATQPHARLVRNVLGQSAWITQSDSQLCFELCT